MKHISCKLIRPASTSYDVLEVDTSDLSGRTYSNLVIITMEHLNYQHAPLAAK